jgi:YHS domain-containing protein
MKTQTFLFLTLIILTPWVYAQTPVFQLEGVAINGYDPVAYFLENKPVAGKAEYAYSWNEANWRFASAENLEIFKQKPEQYAPQYGGYCAFGASRGYLASTEPEAFTIVNDKLYLNYNLEVKTEWVKDMSERILKADHNWETKLKLKSK